MTKILEMRARRARLWDAAKAFLDTHRAEDGSLSVSFDMEKVLDLSTRIVDLYTKDYVYLNTGAGVAGPIPLPTNIHKYTIQRSVHVDKKSREQFEMRIHKRLMDILEPTQQTVDALGKLSLPAGVDVEIKL